MNSNNTAGSRDPLTSKDNMASGSKAPLGGLKAPLGSGNAAPVRGNTAPLGLGSAAPVRGNTAPFGAGSKGPLEGSKDPIQSQKSSSTSSDPGQKIDKSSFAKGK